MNRYLHFIIYSINNVYIHNKTCQGDNQRYVGHLIFWNLPPPRRNGEVVLAADYSLGESSGAYAVKRLREKKASWIFESSNPVYNPVVIPKTDVSYPILGTYVGSVGS